LGCDVSDSFSVSNSSSSDLAVRTASADPRSGAGSSSGPAAGGAANGPGASAGASGQASQSDLQQQGRLFRTLMSGNPLTARELAALAAKGMPGGMEASLLDTTGAYGFDDFRKLGNSSHKGEGDASAMMLTQRLVDQGPVAQNVAASGAPDMSFAELIEKHVRRALASQDAAGASRGGEVRLELSDAVLPGTAISLRRTASGWQLAATADNARSREMLNRYAPALVARFAQASLGHLDISVESA